jgi:ribonucleases P/MRP protein subunit RPP40
LLETLNDWTLATKNRRSVTVAYIDYQKAFYAVSHYKLLAKLESYGIEGNIREWIRNFLNNRTQQTTVGSAFSDVGNLASDVVQRSVIGPMLFLLYINDVISLLADDRCTCKLYADDVKMYTSLQIYEDISILKQKLDDLYTWSVLWQLRISYKMCQMSIHNFNTDDTSMHVSIMYYLVGLKLMISV